ncbi:hypothetical protein [Methylobacterium komagatae]
MAGLNVQLNIGAKVAALAGGWVDFTEREFAREFQFSLTGVGIDAVNRWRRAAPDVMDHPTQWILQGVRYEVDRAALASIERVDQAHATVFVQPDRTPIMKYGFGETHRPGGDVGIEGWFANQNQIYLPVEDNLAKTAGIRPNAYGNLSGRQVKALASQMAGGYQRNVTANSRWRPFEIKPGDCDPARLGVGIHMAPPRGLATKHRERLKRKMAAGKAEVPRTQFTATGGRQVDVPKVVNLDVPRMVFVTTQEGVSYELYLTPSWEECMTAAAETLADRMAVGLADKMEHAARKALGGR